MDCFVAYAPRNDGPTNSASRHTPRLLSHQPPPASRQFSFTSSTGVPQSNGARSKFSAGQSPSSQSPLVCHSGNVVAISQVEPYLRKFAAARSIFANDRCTKCAESAAQDSSRQRIPCPQGSA